MLWEPNNQNESGCSHENHFLGNQHGAAIFSGGLPTQVGLQARILGEHGELWAQDLRRDVCELGFRARSRWLRFGVKVCFGYSDKGVRLVAD